MFVIPTEIKELEASNERTRYFTVRALTDGDTRIPYIEVEGLVSLEGVSINHQPAPLTSERVFWSEAPGKEPTTIKADVPLFALSALPDGTPILQRSIYSNDGYWNVGERVGVIGEWTNEPASEFVPVDKHKAAMDALAAENAALKDALKKAATKKDK